MVGGRAVGGDPAPSVPAARGHGPVEEVDDGEGFGVRGAVGAGDGDGPGRPLGRAAHDPHVASEIDAGPLGPEGEEQGGDQVGGPSLADAPEVDGHPGCHGGGTGRRLEREAGAHARGARRGHDGRIPIAGAVDAGGIGVGDIGAGGTSGRRVGRHVVERTVVARRAQLGAEGGIEATTGDDLGPLGQFEQGEGVRTHDHGPSRGRRQP